MKAKLFGFAAAVVAGLSAHAGVLHWQVSEDATTETWSKAAVAVYPQNTTPTSAADASSAEGYLVNQTGTSSGSSMMAKSDVTPGPVAATGADMNTAPDIVGIDSTSYAGKLFYIELYDSNNNIVARSKDYLSFDTNGHLVSSNASVTDDFLSTSAFMENATIWNGGTFAVVPEPTSGLMLLLGAAVLGLRRKRRV